MAAVSFIIAATDAGALSSRIEMNPAIPSIRMCRFLRLKAIPNESPFHSLILARILARNIPKRYCKSFAIERTFGELTVEWHRLVTGVQHSARD
jgi:hypothetical protein